FAHFGGGLSGIDEETTPAHYVDNPMFDLLGVRYIVTKRPIDEEPSPGDPTPSTQWKLVAQSDGVFIYEAADPTPRPFVVHDVRAVPNEGAAKAALHDPSGPYADGPRRVTGLDPEKTAVVEAPASELDPGIASCSGESPAEIVSYHATSIEIAVDAACPG